MERPADVWSPAIIALAGMAALAVPMGIGRFAFTPILPMMQSDAGLSVAAGGWLASANYFGTLVGALAAMAMRIPAQTAIRGGLLTIGITTIAMGVEHRLVGWMLLRTIAGFATAWVLVFASAWSLERLGPLRRPALNSTVFAGYGVGIAAAGALCLVLMSVGSSSAQAWLSLGGVSLVVTAAIWPVFSARHDGSRESRHVTTGGPRWDAESARLVLCYGAFGFGYIVPATFLPVMARHAIADPSIFGWAWPIFGAAAAGSTFVAGLVSTVVSNRRLWSLSHVVMACGVVLPAIWPGIAWVMLSALLVGGTFTVTTMTGFQEARLVGGPNAKSLIGAFASAFAVGQIVALVGVSYAAPTNFATALIVASMVLMGSAWALCRP